MSVNKEIYLINNGLSCQEIYKILYEQHLIKKKEGMPIRDDHKKNIYDLKREKNNKLSLNGIIETRELKKNKIMNILKDSNNTFYSLCDRTSIESGLIFLNGDQQIDLNILPLISYSNIKKPNEITEFINSFTSNNKNMKQYWKINNNIINNKNNVNLEWDEINNKTFSEVKHFSIDNLIKNILNDRKSINPNHKVILFCNDIIIKKFLQLIKNEKYKPGKTMKIYNTHCIKLTLNQVGTDIKCNEFSTIYPRELEHDPLLLKNDNFIYKFKGFEYRLSYRYLFKKSKNIYKNDFKVIQECRCYHEDKVKKVLKILNNTVHNGNKNIKNIKNSSNFDNIFNKLNGK